MQILTRNCLPKVAQIVTSTNHPTSIQFPSRNQSKSIAQNMKNPNITFCTSGVSACTHSDQVLGLACKSHGLEVTTSKPRGCNQGWSLAKLFPQTAPPPENLDLALDLAGKINLRYISPWSPSFYIKGWSLACNSPTRPPWQKNWACSGTCLPKASSDNEANGNQHFQNGLGPWPEISPTGPIGKKSGHVLGPAWQKSPQIVELMEASIFQKGPGPWPEISPTGPICKIVAMFWDLPGQSHLR